MACTGLPISSSTITCLDFNLAWDISVVPATVTITNNSTVANYALLKWWFYVISPSGVAIYGVDINTVSPTPAPDIDGISWTTKTINLPTPFGNAPCGQIEFSPNNPYSVVVFVEDESTSPPSIYSFTKNTIITRPNGNTSNSCGNFGCAVVSMKSDCANKQIMCFDNTKLIYNNIQTPASTSNLWTLVYPQDASGEIPNRTASNVPNVNFPTSVDSKGYVIYFQEYATYNYGGGITVTVQYKLFDPSGSLGRQFAINCNTNLCQVQCQMQKFYKLALGSCGTLVNAELLNKMTEMNFIFSTQVLTGIFQPLCGIDVPEAIERINKIGNFDDNCDCGCGGDNGFSNPTGAGSAGACCPTSSNVIDINTGIVPALCPDSYFPVQVYDPTAVTVIGIAYDANSLISILNSNAAWQAFGTAFNEGNCVVGWYPATQGGTIPVIKVGTTGTTSGCVGGKQNYIVNMADVCFPSTPITPSSFPCNAWVDFGLGAGPVYLGNVASQTDLVTALNATATKPGSITFSAGSTVSQVVINNSNCTLYSGAISITCDVGSSSFLLYGSSHIQMVSGATAHEAIEGYGLRTNALLGKLPGMPTTHSPWHIIKIQNFLITAEGDTGKIYFYDITNPLVPTLARIIQLNTVVSGANGNFTNTPTSLGLGSQVVNSIYSLYFPTDTYNMMSLNAIYIFEGKTGSAWEINFYDPGSGITASFHDNQLIGKVPRVLATHIVNSNLGIYFTQDGTLETDISGSSGILEGYIVVLDLASGFVGANISTQQILLNQTEYVWAAAYDGADTIWFLGQFGTMGKYSISTNTVVSRYGNSLGVFSSTARKLLRRGNMKYFNGRMFVSSLGPFDPIGFAQGCLYLDVATLPTSTNATLFTGNLSFPSLFAHNILPLGNCLVVATFDNGGLTPGQGSVQLYKTDGTFMMATFLNAGQAVYNFIALQNVNVYTPNNLIPG